jgi:FAD/FMN-containing dehydrogenase
MSKLNRRDFLRDGIATAAGLWISLGAGSCSAERDGRTRGRRDAGDLDELARRLTGDLLRPDDPRYEEASRPANGRYADTRPVAVAQCATEEDVATCVRWCVEYGVSPVARGGGHSYAGFSTTTGLLVDLRRLNAVEINPSTGEMTIGGAALNQDVFDKTRGKAHDGPLILPAGTCLGVGVGGLVLGGGIGYNTHWAGLTSDHLKESRIVTASGDLLTINATRHPDLFWACRGGAGGSFGINTAFTFDLQPVPPGDVTYFRLDWRGAEAAKGVLATFDRILVNAPAAFNAVAMAQAAPLKGSEDPREAIAVMSRGHFLGSRADLLDLIAPLLKVGTPKRDVRVMRFWEMQEIWVSKETTWHSFGDTCRYAATPLPDRATNELVERLVACPYRSDSANGSIWSLGWVGGPVVDQFAPADTAYVHRNMLTLLRPTIVWPNGEEAIGDALQRWADAMTDIMAPHVPHRSYQNFPNRGLLDWADAYYGENYERLVAVKTDYDSHNLFTNPQSVPPRGVGPPPASSSPTAPSPA